MLSFADQVHFRHVYDCLETAYEAHLDAFGAQYGYLSEDDYNDMADQLGFVEEQPLIEFEGAIPFNSYRAAFAAQEEVWLANGGDPEFGPDASNRFEDDLEATLMNSDGAVMIGGVIHLTTADGRVIEFCSCAMYERYLLDPASVDPNDPCVTFHKNLYYGNGACCRSYQMDKGGDEYDQGSRKITWTLLFEYNNTWDVSRTFAKIRHWRWRNGRWKARSAEMLAQVPGTYSTVDCREGGTCNASKEKKRRTLKATYWHWQPQTIITFKTGEANGYWEYPQGNTLSHSLQFPC